MVAVGRIDADQFPAVVVGAVGVDGGGGGSGVAAAAAAAAAAVAGIHCNSLDNVVAEACVAAKTINHPQYFHNPVTR